MNSTLKHTKLLGSSKRELILIKFQEKFARSGHVC